VDAGFRLTFGASNPVARHQAIQIVAIRAIRAKSFFIKQAFDAASQTNLVGVILEAYRPAHPAVPAAAENHYASRAQSGGNHPEGP